jgi:hypothetical protein
VHVGDGAEGLVAYSLSTALRAEMEPAHMRRLLAISRPPPHPAGARRCFLYGQVARLAKFLPGWVMQAAHTG